MTVFALGSRPEVGFLVVMLDEIFTVVFDHPEEAVCQILFEASSCTSSLAWVNDNHLPEQTTDGVLW